MTVCARNWATIVLSSGSNRFLVEVVACHAAAYKLRPANQRMSRWYSRGSTSSRSLLIEWSSVSSRARSSYTGGIVGHPV